MNQREFLTAIGCCLLLAGCGQQLVRDAQESPTSRREASKNYVLGQEQSAYVGDAIARVKDYLVTVSTSQIAVPSERGSDGHNRRLIHNEVAEFFLKPVAQYSE